MNRLVTVYIPTHNRLDLLKRAIDSVLRQTYSEIEIIVVNDFSQDGTKDYLDSIRGEKIKVIHNCKPKGACVSRNKAIEIASGHYITGLDDDDYFKENRIEELVTAYEETEDKYCLATFDTPIQKVSNNNYTHHRTAPEQVKIYDLVQANHVSNQILIETKNFRHVCFDTKFKAWQDWDCWVSILKHFGEGYYFKWINKGSYCVDISHPHERITSKSSANIDSAYAMFLVKHSDIINDDSSIRIKYLNYPQVKLSADDIKWLISKRKFKVIFKKIGFLNTINRLSKKIR